jgi:hypothetical protein
MVKRTIFKRSFAQCDLSGLPLPRHVSLPYMPVVSPEGKVHKKGQFANWECVMRAIELTDWPDAEARFRAVQHIQAKLRGILPDGDLADVGLLAHFDGQMSAAQWHTHIMSDETPVSTVCLYADGSVDTGSVPANWACGQGLFACAHTAVYLDGRELVVFWDPLATEPNPKARELARMPELVGDVTAVLCIDDECFLRRNRFVHCTPLDLDPPVRKRKPPIADNAATLAEFKLASKRMATDFRAYEAEMSKDAVVPNTIAPGMVMPAPTGAELAAVARMRGFGGGSPPSSARAAPA